MNIIIFHKKWVQKLKKNTCLWIKTTDPNNLHVPPWRSTWSIRKICKNLTPRIATVPKIWPFEPTAKTITEAETTTRSEIKGERRNVKDVGKILLLKLNTRNCSNFHFKHIEKIECTTLFVEKVCAWIQTHYIILLVLPW